jgi:hypothetical protein
MKSSLMNGIMEPLRDLKDKQIENDATELSMLLSDVPLARLSKRRKGLMT